MPTSMAANMTFCTADQNAENAAKQSIYAAFAEGRGTGAGSEPQEQHAGVRSLQRKNATIF